MKRIGLGFLLMIMKIISIVTGCGGQSTTEENETLEKPELTTTPYKKTEFLMGTVVTVKIYDKGKEAVLEPAFERIQTLADQITVNEAGSEIDAINANAGIKPVKVSKDIFELMDAGNAYSIQSNGSFDISIGPLTDLWRIGFPDARKPTQSEIDAVLPSIDYTQIELNEEEQTVFLKNKGMRLDLGAIAKGFITDQVAEVLKENDVTTAIIDLGGNIYVMGNNPSGKDWTVGIQDPFAARRETIARNVLEQVGLNPDILTKSPFSLSGGQKRRVAIAGILAMEPDVLVLDEPAAGLDPAGKQEILSLISSWHLERGMTTVLVTHDMDDVVTYADKVIVMDKGQVVFHDDVENVFSDHEQLEKWHLDVPDARRFQLNFERETGIKLPKNCLTLDELADALIEVGLA